MSYNMCKFHYKDWEERFKLIEDRKKDLKSIGSKEEFVRKLYLEQMNKDIDFKNPQTFTEKINCFKLNFTKKYSDLTDKNKVRKYIVKKVGNEILIPKYFCKRKITEKDLINLPNEFVLKTNNGSGTNYIVKDKTKEDLKEICKYLNYLSKIEYQYLWGEFHYSKIKPRIVCEKLLHDKNNNIPDDLKCFCFNSKSGDKKRILYYERVIDDERYRIMFDENWEPINIKSSFKKLKIDIKKPKNYKEILRVIDKLSEDFGFVRVDLFLFDNKIYFGELTFTPTAGYLKFDDDTSDLLWGSYFDKV